MSDENTSQPRDAGRTVQAWMSRELLAELDEAAAALGWSRSQLIVRASRHYLRELRRENERLPAPYQLPT